MCKDSEGPLRRSPANPDVTLRGLNIFKRVLGYILA